MIERIMSVLKFAFKFSLYFLLLWSVPIITYFVVAVWFHIAKTFIGCILIASAIFVLYFFGSEIIDLIKACSRDQK